MISRQKWFGDRSYPVVCCHTQKNKRTDFLGKVYSTSKARSMFSIRILTSTWPKLSIHPANQFGMDGNPVMLHRCPRKTAKKRETEKMDANIVHRWPLDDMTQTNRGLGKREKKFLRLCAEKKLTLLTATNASQQQQQPQYTVSILCVWVPVTGSKWATSENTQARARVRDGPNI